MKQQPSFSLKVQSLSKYWIKVEGRPLVVSIRTYKRTSQLQLKDIKTGLQVFYVCV